MSITIRPIPKLAACQCNKYMRNGKPDPDCTECKGTGNLHTEDYRLQMTEIRFRTLWSALGLDPYKSGVIDPVYLINAINACRPGLAVTTDGYYIPEGDSDIATKRVPDDYPGKKLFFPGMTEAMIAHRFSVLKDVAKMALATNSNVIWD